MKVAATYSHLNGLEFLLVHKRSLWEEITCVIEQVDAAKCLIKESREKRTRGQCFYDPKEMNRKFKELFRKEGWKENRVSYYVTDDAQLIRKTLSLAPEEQMRLIEQAGRKALRSYNQTDFVQDRVAVEVQFGKYAFVAYDLFVKHLAFYVGDCIDVGVEILPMKSMQSQMSSGVGYYEAELYNVLRHGRGVPAVPLVLVGVEP